MIKKFLTLFLIVPFLAACPKPEPEPGPDVPPGPDPGPETQAEIVISSPAAFDMPYAGGEATLSFTSNVDWKVASLDSWVTVSPESGAASASAVNVKLSVEANPGTAARSATIYIFAGDATETVTVNEAFDFYMGAEAELVSGSTVLATNPNVEKFLNEVNYPDRDWTYTKVLDYYGGFNGKTYNDNGQEDPNGKMFNWAYEPFSDKPCSYSIRWNPEDMEAGDMTLTLEDQLDWRSETTVKEGSRYVNITNLVPNDHYTYKVTTAGGKVLAQGDFNTTGSLHQVYFAGKLAKGGCRNGRDLGGWTGLGGKKIKYRLLYRGGRMEEISVADGGPEAMAQGIGAELDLRNSDRLSKAAVPGLDFCAPGIEQGGTWMLKNGNSNGNFGKQCFEFVVNSVRAGKGVFFHCSLGRDRTGTLDILLLGLLGVREGDIGKAYEVTYFAPVGYSVSSSEKSGNPTPVFKNTRNAWVYSDVVPYFWGLADQTEGKTFADGVEKYLLEVAGVSQQDIDDFRNLMLE
ncbi:MAG: tyrosine-protein phosphatase [Bacteroidales bacterium]|nr:tyrosine-protein phosphatase [Bacteroidales bacterium]MBQ7459108.1 tyrosine-protein phosphatase [Bacteroidales bacterium]